MYIHASYRGDSSGVHKHGRYPSFGNPAMEKESLIPSSTSPGPRPTYSIVQYSRVAYTICMQHSLIKHNMGNTVPGPQRYVKSWPSGLLFRSLGVFGLRTFPVQVTPFSKSLRLSTSKCVKRDSRPHHWYSDMSAPERRLESMLWQKLPNMA